MTSLCPGVVVGALRLACCLPTCDPRGRLPVRRLALDSALHGCLPGDESKRLYINVPMARRSLHPLVQLCSLLLLTGALLLRRLLLVVVREHELSRRLREPQRHRQRLERPAGRLALADAQPGLLAVLAPHICERLVRRHAVGQRGAAVEVQQLRDAGAQVCGAVAQDALNLGKQIVPLRVAAAAAVPGGADCDRRRSHEARGVAQHCVIEEG